MGSFEASRSGLCLYECLRLFFLIGVFILFEPFGSISFPWLAAVTPGAMFLLITVFLRLNLARYRIYAPLYIAGKGLSVMAVIFWLFFSKNDIIKDLFLNRAALYFVPGTVFFFLLGDIISVWLVSKMMKK